MSGQSQEFLKLKESWTAKLEKFISNLRILAGKNQLTEANVAKLFTATANFPAAAGSLVPGASVPAEWTSTGVRCATYGGNAKRCSRLHTPYPVRGCSIGARGCSGSFGGERRNTAGI